MKVVEMYSKHPLLASLSDYLLLDKGLSMGTDVLEILAMAKTSEGWKCLSDVEKENMEFRMIQTAMFISGLDEHTAEIHTGTLTMQVNGMNPTEPAPAMTVMLEM